MTWTKIGSHGNICPTIPATGLPNRSKAARVEEISYDQNTIVGGRANYKILLAEDHQLGTIQRSDTFVYNAKGTSNTNADNSMTLKQEVGLRKLICSSQYPLNG
ncbi:hypothetical protein [Dapis sp. BLCC M229]|uniref:hypothetical protein n=1 Tax=Dapis sp. BLCC M229 TaxID=3400188 RepID=UPI003CEC65CA